MKRLNYSKATAFLAAFALAIPAAHAATYTWISSGNPGQNNNLDNTANWLLDGSPATNTPSASNDQLSTHLLADPSGTTIIFDSTNFTTTPRNIYPRNNSRWASIVVPNGTINFQNDGNNQGNHSFGDSTSGNTPTMTVGNGNATAARVNFNVTAWNTGNGAKSYVINSDGTLSSNRGGNHTWSSGTNYTLMRILGGTVLINGAFAESNFTAGQDDYVSFEALDSMFTFAKGGAGSFQNDTDVTSAFGSIFRLGGSLNSGNAALELTDGGTTWTITATDITEPSPAAFALTITPATAPDTGFDLAWASQSGKLYNLRTSNDLTGAISTWTLVEGDIEANPPTNTANVDPADSRRFCAVEEFDAPPVE